MGCSRRFGKTAPGHTDKAATRRTRRDCSGHREGFVAPSRCKNACRRGRGGGERNEITARARKDGREKRRQRDNAASPGRIAEWPRQFSWAEEIFSLGSGRAFLQSRKPKNHNDWH